MLARDPMRREALGAAGFDRLQRHFSMQDTIELLGQRFRDLLGQAPEDTVPLREIA